MVVRVLYFAALRDKLNVEEESMELPARSKLTDLLTVLRARGQEWHAACDPAGALRMAVNQEFADVDAELIDDCEVALFPPITGG